jgi:prephenate dehydratase
MEFQQVAQFEAVMELLKSATNNLRVFGIYKKGKRIKG